MLNRLVSLVCLVLLSAATLFVTPFATPAIADSSFNEPAATLANGAEVFQAHCEGCHLNGGNIIRRGKTLKLNALKRNGMDSADAIAAIVTNGKNNMSAFRDRLSDQQIQAVATYVLNQAEADWKKLPAA